MIKFQDRVKVISSNYSCANVDDMGTIVDNGYLTKNGLMRYLVRWDSNPDMLWGVHSDCIEKLNIQ